MLSLEGLDERANGPQHDNDDEEIVTDEELEPWVRIQQHTFTNWVNDKIQHLDLSVEDMRRDFRDGVFLCRLMESLKGTSIGRVNVKKRLNHYEASGNLELAFQAMKSDNVRLVNIGSEDIRSGNLKLILGMMWTLIRFYQIGNQGSGSNKHLMLSWINAILHPHLTIYNFSTDWNSGLALKGVIEYCLPDTNPGWYNMTAYSGFKNCEQGLQLADELFNIPMLLSAQDLSSSHVDELSVMTYMSYFMTPEAPGHDATLNWVRGQIQPESVGNFDTDWNDGHVLAALVNSLGGDVYGWPDIDISNPESTIHEVMAVSERTFAVKPIVKSRDMIKPDVDHIGVMAYAAWHQSKTKRPESPKREETPPPPSIVSIKIPPPTPSPSLSPAASPSPSPSPEYEPTPPPTPPLPRKLGIPAVVLIWDNWAIDTTQTIRVVSTSALRGHVSGRVEAPSGDEFELMTSHVNSATHHIEFTPTEKGQWSVYLKLNDEIINGSPYSVNVYDPAVTRLVREYTVAAEGTWYIFDVNCVKVGLMEADVCVLCDGVVVPHEVTEEGEGRHRVRFLPQQPGTYTVLVHCGGVGVPGSPFDVDVRAGDQVEARGEGLRRAACGSEAAFQILAESKPDQVLEVEILSPSDCEVPVKTSRETSGIINISYLPTEEGRYMVSAVYGGDAVRGSPFAVDVSTSRVYITDFPAVVYNGKKASFKLDASEMAKGMLEIDSDMPVHSYDKVGINTYVITIIPRRTGHHDMLIKYNSLLVPGAPFRIEVRE